MIQQLHFSTFGDSLVVESSRIFHPVLGSSEVARLPRLPRLQERDLLLVDLEKARATAGSSAGPGGSLADPRIRGDRAGTVRPATWECWMLVRKVKAQRLSDGCQLSLVAVPLGADSFYIFPSH